MKKYIPIMLSVLILTACGTKEEIEGNEEAAPIENKNETVEMNEAEQQTEVVENKSSMDYQYVVPSNWAISMPNAFPEEQGKYITAVTQLEGNVLTYQFYEVTEKLSLDDPNIKEKGKYIGKLTITQFASKQLASEEIDQSVFKDGEKVDLGHSITGYQDAGAGSLFTSWNEGRWAIIARSLTEKAEESVQTAKATVEFLETNTLPIPKDYGYLHVDAEQTGTMAKWQKDEYVFALTDFGANTLPWIVTFK